MAVIPKSLVAFKAKIVVGVKSFNRGARRRRRAILRKKVRWASRSALARNSEHSFQIIFSEASKNLVTLLAATALSRNSFAALQRKGDSRSRCRFDV